MPGIPHVLGRQRLVNYDVFLSEAVGVAHKILPL